MPRDDAFVFFIIWWYVLIPCVVCINTGLFFNWRDLSISVGFGCKVGTNINLFL